MKVLKLTLTILVIILAFSACQKNQHKPEMNAEEEAVETSTEDSGVIEVVLKNEDHAEIGMASLTERDDGVEIKVEANHITPGLHGIHIHEKGICEAPDFETAGSHFNPDKKEHGLNSEQGSHAGDLENLLVEEDGMASQTFINKHVTLKRGKPNSLLDGDGTSLIIHADEDDQVTQPTGNAGERIGCGVISPSGEKDEDDNDR